jgi:hypothetical protein
VTLVFVGSYGNGKERLLCIKKKKKGRDVVEMLFCNGKG